MIGRPPSASVALLIANLVVLAGCERGTDPGTPAYRLDEVQAVYKTVGRLFIADLDHDGLPEFIRHRPEKLFLWKQPNITNALVEHPFLDGTSSFNGRFLDVAGDTDLEIIVSRHAAGRSWLEMYSARGDLLRSFSPIPEFNLANQAESLSCVEPWDVMRENGTSTLYCTSNTGYRGTPCAVLAFDGATGQLLWRYDMGPAPRSCRLMWTSGHPALMVGSHATNHGVSANGLSDTTSVIMALDPYTGGLLWHRTIGRRNSIIDVHPIDLDGDERDELVSVYTAGRGDSLSGSRLEVWPSGESRARWRYAFDAILTTEPIIADLNGDGLQEVIAGDLEGGLWVLDHDLRLHARADLGSPAAEPVGVGLIDPLSQRLIAAVTEDAVHVLEPVVSDSHWTLSSVAVRPCTQRAACAFVRTSSGRLLALSETGFGLYQLLPRPAGALPVWLRALFWALLAGPLAWAIVTGIRLYRGSSERQSETAWSELHHHLVGFLHAESNSGHIIALLAALQQDREPPPYPSSGGGAQAAYARLMTDTAPALRKIDRIARRGSLRKLIRADLSRPLAALGPALVDSGTSGSRDDAIMALRELEAGIRRIRAAVRWHFRADAVAIARSVLSQHLDDPERGLSRGRLVLEEPLSPWAGIDPDDLHAILSELLTNGEHAMRVAISPPEVEISLRSDTAYVYIVVADNGPGIPEGDREAVFRRGHSSRGSSGQGLPWCRKTLHGWDARIRVLAAGHLGGARIEVRLRRSDSPNDEAETLEPEP